MRHQMATKKLNRAVGPRRSLLNNLLAQLFTYESIATTEAKAKTVKAFADRLIYQAKPQTMAVRRRLQSKLTDPILPKGIRACHPVLPGFPVWGHAGVTAP